MSRMGLGKFSKKFYRSPAGGKAGVTAISSATIAVAKARGGASGDATRCTSAQIAVTYPSSTQLWAGRSTNSAWLNVWLVKSS